VKYVTKLSSYWRWNQAELLLLVVRWKEMNIAVRRQDGFVDLADRK